MSDKSLGASSPCKDCHRKLVSLGIKRVVYSEKNNEFIRAKPSEINPYGETTGRRYIENDYHLASKKHVPCEY